MISDYYTQNFTVTRISSSIDSDNFDIQSPVVYYSGKGSLEPLNGNERVFNDKYESYSTHRLFCPIINILESDSITVESRNYYIDLIQNFRNHHLEIILIERK